MTGDTDKGVHRQMTRERGPERFGEVQEGGMSKEGL